MNARCLAAVQLLLDELSGTARINHHKGGVPAFFGVARDTFPFPGFDEWFRPWPTLDCVLGRIYGLTGHIGTVYRSVTNPAQRTQRHGQA